MAPGRTSDADAYDYIICGGGTSGSVIAGRLAEDLNVSILVVAAGPDNAELENVHMAGGWSQNFDAETDWNIESVPMPGVNGRTVKNSRGRFLGGSSGCNGTLCIRGSQQDYDDWGIEGWSGKDMHKYMAKAETFHPRDWFKADEKSHGYSGPLHTEPHDLAPISDLVMQSYQDLGMPLDDDMFTHGRTSHGCGHVPRTVFQGIRTTGADFITKGYRRENITIFCETTVDKVLFEDHNGAPHARSVALIAKDGTPHTVHARREIIISGGSYCSPAILMRSGIGPKNELEKLGIESLVNLSGVGQNLMDHLIVFIFYEVNRSGLTNDHMVYHGPDAFATTYKLWKEKKTGFLSTFPFGAFAYARLDERLADSDLWKNAPRREGRDPMDLTSKQPNVEFWNTECYGGPKQYTDFPVDEKHTFAMIPELFSPRSRGSVTLKSTNPLDNPIIDHNYLADPLDLLVLTEACRLGNEVVMKGTGTKPVVKGSWPADLKHHTHQTREDWTEYVKNNATTCYHPGGTCKMGNADDQTAVVDERLRVKGIKGLRVADVSIMPRLNQGHTQMPAYGIGEGAAELIKEDAGRRTNGA